MKLTKQFLQKYTAGPDHAVALNKAQALIVGLKYPLRTGWLQPLLEKNITEEGKTKFKMARHLEYFHYIKKYGTGSHVY